MKSMDLTKFGREIEKIIGVWGNTETQIWIFVAFTVGIATVLVEFALGAAIFSGYRLNLTFRSTFALLSVFILVILSAIFKGDVNDCACFGSLIKRSLPLALIEDIILLTITWLGIRATRKLKEHRNFIKFITIKGLCLGWLIFFLINPPANAVIKEQSSIEVEYINDKLTDDRFLLWVFDPDCEYCQEKVIPMNELSFVDPSIKIIGITNSTIGRITEFKLDFEPTWGIIKVDDDIIEKIHLPSGSILVVEDGIVKEIFRTMQWDETDLSFAMKDID